MRLSGKQLISAERLADLMEDENLVVVHAGSGNGRELYDNSHIDGAIYLDLDQDLSDIKEDAAYGGRHPLPSPRFFGEMIGNVGIAPDSHLVVYDDKAGANAASRFWWMMKSIGHEKVQLLNGGFQTAEKAGVPINSEVVTLSLKEPYPVSEWKLPMVDIDQVEKSAQDQNAVVIDVRAAFRYNGESEPIDLVAGHIPGAINFPLSENLNENGLFLSPEKLRAKYAETVKGKEVTIHCGSGVTACHTILALASAGFEIPSLYVGSWSEWSRNEKQIAKAPSN